MHACCVNRSILNGLCPSVSLRFSTHCLQGLLKQLSSTNTPVSCNIPVCTGSCLVVWRTGGVSLPARHPAAPCRSLTIPQDTSDSRAVSNPNHLGKLFGWYNTVHNPLQAHATAQSTACIDIRPARALTGPVVDPIFMLLRGCRSLFSKQAVTINMTL